MRRKQSAPLLTYCVSGRSGNATGVGAEHATRTPYPPNAYSRTPRGTGGTRTLEARRGSPTALSCGARPEAAGGPPWDRTIFDRRSALRLFSPCYFGRSRYS